jgi:prolyl 4-hydroxylase
MALWWSTNKHVQQQQQQQQSVIVRFVSNGANYQEYINPSESHKLSCSTTTTTTIFDFDTYNYYLPNGILVSSLNDVCTVATNHENNIFVTRVPKSQHYVWPAPYIGHNTSVSLQDGTKIRLEVLASSPRILYVHNFLSESEANDLISYAQSDKNPYKMAPSTTGTEMWNHMSEERRKSAISSRRTSTNAFVLSTPTAKRLKRRAFDMLNLKYDEEMADGIQVLRYDRKQAYVAHTDYFPVSSNTERGSHNFDSSTGGTNRFATVFLYLNDVEEGGQTVFPLLDRNHTSSQEDERKSKEETEWKDSWEGNMVKQCRTKFSVQAKKGSAILFYSQLADGTLDPRSLHGGCPVLSGEKWAANLWVWNGCRYGLDCKS